MRVIGKRVHWTLHGKRRREWASGGGVPLSLDIRAFILQENDLPGVVATHFSIGVVDDAEFIITGK